VALVHLDRTREEPLGVDAAAFQPQDESQSRAQ
jgi:hypothetical protein